MIPLTGTGGLFTRLGTIGGALNDVSAFAGTTNLTAAGIKSTGPATDAIAAQFQAADQNLINGLYANRDQYRQAHSSWLQSLQALAQAVVIQMANDDTPLSSQTLFNALTLLISQMKTASQTVQKPTISTIPTAGSSNVGTGILMAAPLGESGLQQDYIYNESITGTVVADGQGAGVAGQEQFLFLSPAAEQNPLMWDWPLGTGIGFSQNAVDALVDASSGNLLQNGSFKQWTNPLVGPDNWLILTGTTGTTIVQTTGGNVYKGSTSIAFVGNGAELTAISQPFGATPATTGNSGGTSITLGPLSQYAFNFWLKMSAVPAAGVLEVDLTDGNNNIVNDANGVPNSLSINLTGATTSFVNHNAFFRTPAVNPSTGYRLRVRLTTALDNAKSVYFGHAGMMQAVPLYADGPQIGLFSGATNFILGDLFTLAVANNYGSAWQKLMERLFGMRALDLQLPSGGSPTILDSLIA